MNKEESNCCVTEELLAVIYCTQYFIQYLLGRKFKVRTNHQALTLLLRLKKPSGRIARWTEIFASYEFELEYRPDRQQGHCDAHSLCPSPRDCQCHEVDTFELLLCGSCQNCKKRAQSIKLEGAQAVQHEAEIRIHSSKSEQDVPCTNTAIKSFPKLMSSIGNMTLEDIRKHHLNDPDTTLVLKTKESELKPSYDEMRR